jgi:flagellar protein FlaF
MSAAYLEAYKTAKTSNMSGREIEAMALTSCANMLSDCQKNWDAPDREGTLNEVLRINQRVWSILQAELTRKDNPLPKKLKEDLLSLSIFIDKRTIQVMAHQELEKLNILININLNIAAGLNTTPKNNEQAVGQVLPMPKRNHVEANFHV